VAVVTSLALEPLRTSCLPWSVEHHPVAGQWTPAMPPLTATRGTWILPRLGFPGDSPELRSIHCYICYPQIGSSGGWIMDRARIDHPCPPDSVRTHAAAGRPSQLTD
jgi:hypothetical protein